MDIKNTGSKDLNVRVTTYRELQKAMGGIFIGNTLPITHRKVLNILWWNAQEHGLTGKHRMSLFKIFLALEASSRNYDWLRGILRELVTHEIEWDILALDSQHRWGITHALAHAQTIDKTVLEYSLPVPAIEMTKASNRMARLDLSVQAKFKQASALTLWEMLELAVQDQTAVQEVRFSVEELSIVLIDRASTKELLRDARKAVDEINKVSGLECAIATEKDGRRVSHVRFTARRVKPRPPVSSTPEFDWAHNDLYMRLFGDFGIPDIYAREFVQKFDPEHLAALLDNTAELFRAKKIKNLSGYTFKMLKEATPHQAALEVDPGKGSEARAYENILEERERDVLRFERHQRKKAEELYGLLSQEQQERYRQQFTNTLPKSQAAKFESLGLKDERLREQFLAFMAMKLLSDAEDISFDAWKKAQRNLLGD